MYGLRRAIRRRFGIDESAARSLVVHDGWNLWLRLLLPCVLFAVVLGTVFVPLLWHELGYRPLVGMLLMLVGLMIAGPSMAKRRLLDSLERRLAANECLRCGYSLDQLEAEGGRRACPECGQVNPAPRHGPGTPSAPAHPRVP